MTVRNQTTDQTQNIVSLDASSIKVFFGKMNDPEAPVERQVVFSKSEPKGNAAGSGPGAAIVATQVYSDALDSILGGDEGPSALQSEPSHDKPPHVDCFTATSSNTKCRARLRSSAIPMG